MERKTILFLFFIVLGLTAFSQGGSPSAPPVPSGFGNDAPGPPLPISTEPLLLIGAVLSVMAFYFKNKFRLILEKNISKFSA